MLFPEKLKAARTKAHLTQEQLAKELHISRQAVTKWETGNGNPDLDNIKRISEILDVSIDYLVKDEVERDPETLSEPELTPQTEIKPEKKRNVLLLCIISVLVTAGLITGGYFGYRYLFADKSSTNSLSVSDKQSSKKAEAMLYDYEDGSKNVIDVLLDYTKTNSIRSFSDNIVLRGIPNKTAYSWRIAKQLDNYPVEYKSKETNVTFTCILGEFFMKSGKDKYLGEIKRCSINDTDDYEAYIFKLQDLEFAAFVYKNVPTQMASEEETAATPGLMDLYLLNDKKEIIPETVFTFYCTSDYFVYDQEKLQRRYDMWNKTKPDILQLDEFINRPEVKPEPLVEDTDGTEVVERSGNNDMWIAGEAIRLDGNGGTE